MTRIPVIRHPADPIASAETLTDKVSALVYQIISAAHPDVDPNASQVPNALQTSSVTIKNALIRARHPADSIPNVSSSITAPFVRAFPDTAEILSRDAPSFHVRIFQREKQNSP